VLHRDRIVKLLSLIISTKNERVNFKSCRNSLKHSGVAGGKWGHVPWGAGLEVHQHIFAVI